MAALREIGVFKSSADYESGGMAVLLHHWLHSLQGSLQAVRHSRKARRKRRRLLRPVRGRFECLEDRRMLNASPVFTGSSYNVEDVPESTTVDTVILSVSATDPEGGSGHLRSAIGRRRDVRHR